MTRESYQTAGVIERGVLRMQDRASFSAAIAEFPDGMVIATFEAASAAAVRSLQSNRFMWVVFTIIANASDGQYTKEQIHDLMCQMHLSYRVDVIDRRTGEVTTHTLVRGTSKLKPKEHTEFLDKVMAWAADFFGCEFPEREAA